MLKQSVLHLMATITCTLFFTSTWAQNAKLGIGGNATAKDTVKANVFSGKALNITGSTAPAKFDSVKITGLSGTGNRTMYVDANGNLRTGNPFILTMPWLASGNTLTATDWFGSENNADVIFKTNTTASPTTAEKMRLKANGNLGIGTNNPKHQLHLHSNEPNGGDPDRLLPMNAILNFDSSGNAVSLPVQTQPDFQTLQITNTTTTDADNRGILFGLSGTSAFLNSQEANGAMYVSAGGGLALTTATGNVLIGVNGAPSNSSVVLQTGSSFSFKTKYGNKMFINSVGNVGIGTSAPTAKLDVAGNGYFSGAIAVNTASLAHPFPPGYSLAVNGSVIAVEYVAKLSSNGGWPDYVFKKNYQLTELSEVEKFVKAESHLPGIPTAKEIADNGISLSEMARMQMQKIEELTLYMIQMNKEIQNLKAENEKLKAGLK